MRVEIVRSGGFAGVRLRATCDVGGASETALRNLPFGQSTPPPPHPDAFVYRLTLLDDPAQPSIDLNEADIPTPLRDTVDEAMSHADLVD